MNVRGLFVDNVLVFWGKAPPRSNVEGIYSSQSSRFPPPSPLLKVERVRFVAFPAPSYQLCFRGEGEAS